MADLTSSLSALYAELKKNHDEAYFVIDKAIKLEEEGKQSEVCWYILYLREILRSYLSIEKYKIFILYQDSH